VTPQLPIPSGQESLTPEWLTHVLRRAGGIDACCVVEVSIEPAGVGQVADCFRCRLSYDDAEPQAPASVIAKLPAQDPTSRESGVAQALYAREVRFYQELADVVGITTPRCLYAEIDASSGMFALVLEDLAPARDADQLAGLSHDDASTAVLELAGLHAARWGDPRRLGLGWLQDLREHSNALYAEFLPPLFDGFVGRYGDQLGPEQLEIITSFKPHLGRFITEQAEPLALIHGDYRSDNMLFDAADGKIPLAVIDWQTILTGPALVDVAFLLGASLEEADRRAHERDLVREYHEALSARGVTGYSWNRCWTDYRRYAYHCLAFLIPASMIVEQTERGDEMFLTMIRRGCAHVTELDSAALVCRTGDGH
jgi:aminoglycoside/choline kinase family phosphotransferase